MGYSLEKLLSLNCLNRIDELFEEYFEIWFIIFNNSIINIDEIWDKYTFISMKSNNSIEYLESMRIDKFNRLYESVKRFVEMENNSQNGGNESNSDVDSMMNQSKNMMKNATQNFKIPKR